MQANVLSSLAQVWDERGDLAQAIGLERQALALRNKLPNPSDRAISHESLSIYFDNAGQQEAGTQHLLAAITYYLVIGSGGIQNALRNLGFRMRRAAAAGQRYDLPRLAALLALPEFSALGQFLAQYSVDVAALQAQVDQIIMNFEL